MTSLLDIGDLTDKVKIGEAEVTVQGVTPEGFFFLLDRFPLLRTLFTKGRASLTQEDIQEAAPGCISYILAVSTTDRGSFSNSAEWRESIEKSAIIAQRLPASYQSKLFLATLKLTFPDGVGPFMSAMADLTTSIGRISGQKMDQVTTSSKRSRSGFSSDSRGLRLGKAAPSASSVH